jgi:hypothetical protein
LCTSDPVDHRCLVFNPVVHLRPCGRSVFCVWLGCAHHTLRTLGVLRSIVLCTSDPAGLRCLAFDLVVRVKPYTRSASWLCGPLMLWCNHISNMQSVQFITLKNSMAANHRSDSLQGTYFLIVIIGCNHSQNQFFITYHECYPSQSAVK